MNNQSNVRLCRAVQHQPCIYDHAVANVVTREAYDRAWLEIAKTCEESVDSCKQRWRSIRTTFAQQLVVSPKKRKGNRARENNLHDVLEFLIPHINDELPFRESDNEGAEIETTRVDNKPQENASVSTKTEVDDDLLEEDAIKRENEQLKGNIKNEVGIKIVEKRNTEDVKVDAAGKRPPSARLKVLRKNSEDIKMAESRPIRKTQSLGKLVNAEEKLEVFVEAEVTKKSTSSKSKVGTFYISPTNSETGTFFIKKSGDSNELDSAPENEANAATTESILGELEHNEIEQPESNVDETEVDEQDDEPEEDFVKTRQYRYKRACKRGSGKKAASQRDLRQKDSSMKSIRRGAYRLKSLGEATNQLIAAAKLSKKTGDTAPVENQSTNLTAHKRTRTLCIPQGDINMVGSQQATVTIMKTLRQESSLSPAEKVALHDLNSSQAYIDQGVQCSLPPASSDDEFFDSLKPYLSEMNARQKLHFKKKIFESLMEVFDSPNDFPTNDETKAIIPKQLSAVSGDELHLVRELVAMVQAAKHTPDLNLSLSGGGSNELAAKTSAEKCAMISPTPSMNLSGGSSELAAKTSAEKCAMISPTPSMRSTPSQPPPPLSLRVSPFNAPTTTAYQNTNRPTPILLSRAGGTATSTQTTSTTTTTPGLRLIRKLVKVNEVGSSAYNLPTTSGAYGSNNGDIVHRRIYRIYPKSNVTNASLENAVNASGVGTFIVPRSTAEATSNKVVTGNKLATTDSSAPTASSTPTASPTPTANTATKQKLRQLVTPVRGVSSSTAVSATSASSSHATVKADRKPPTIRVGARPPARRYSVCGALPNVTASSNYLTTTANTKEPVSTSPKITIAHRCSPAHVVGREVFKLPTPFRSTISSVNATVSTVLTNTISSRTSPALSVSAGDRSPAVRTVPFNMGYKKFVRNDDKTTAWASSSNPKACRDSSSSSHVNVSSSGFTASSPVVGDKRSLPTPAEYGKRNRTLTDQRKDSEAVDGDMADMGIIASDDFAVLNIKTEPADDD